MYCMEGHAAITQVANLARVHGLWNAQGQGPALGWYLEKSLTQRTALQWALVEVEVRRDDQI